MSGRKPTRKLCRLSFLALDQSIGRANRENQESAYGSVAENVPDSRDMSPENLLNCFGIEPEVNWLLTMERDSLAGRVQPIYS